MADRRGTVIYPPFVITAYPCEQGHSLSFAHVGALKESGVSTVDDGNGDVPHGPPIIEPCSTVDGQDRLDDEAGAVPAGAA